MEPAGSEPPGKQVACGSSGLRAFLDAGQSVPKDFRFSLTHILIAGWQANRIRVLASGPVPVAGLTRKKRLAEPKQECVLF